MSEHTKEPWCIGRAGSIVADDPVPEMSGSDAVEYYGGHLICESVVDRNARRIVVCVNACAGIPTDDLETSPKHGLLHLAEFANEIVQQRDELLGALEGLAGDIQGLIEESDGVNGLHLNGDVATWGELEAGGRFERLTHLPGALAAIVKAKGGAA